MMDEKKIDLEAVERDDALIALREIADKEDTDEWEESQAASARTALYCVEEFDADPRMLLAVILSAADGHFDFSPGRRMAPTEPVSFGLVEWDVKRPDGTLIRRAITPDYGGFAWVWPGGAPVGPLQLWRDGKLYAETEVGWYGEWNPPLEIIEGR